MQLSGSLASGDVYVLANSGAIPEILALADTTNNSVINFNGDDAIVLKHNGYVIDSFGKVGEDPGSYWGSEDYTTADHTLVRKSNIISGDTNVNDIFDPSVEWVSFPKDTFTNLDTHKMDGFVGGNTSTKVTNVIANPTPSAVYAGTEVALTTATSDATILYTVQGEVYGEANGYDTYTGPIEINEDTTIIAKAVKDGMEDSEISTFEYTIKSPLILISIAEARNMGLGQEAMVEGIVTYVNGSNSYIQDDTGGINVYKSPVELTVGDIIKVTGKTSEYKGLLELNPTEVVNRE